MLRTGSVISTITAVILGGAFFGYPCPMLAQRGAASVGGPTAGGGAMGRSGPATGLDVKDDLKSYHETLALQASNQQIIEYRLMMKSTESASAELRALLGEAAKENNASSIAERDKAFEQALDKARAQNTTFLQILSDRQKTDLKETIRKLVKADSDLAQQAKAMGLAIDAKTTVGQSIASSVQNLQRTIGAFQDLQLDLGERMSIAPGDTSQEVSFKLPAVKSAVNFAAVNVASVGPDDRSVAITTSGVISKSASQSGENAFHVELTADLSDVQQYIIQILRSQLDKSERCGEQIGIQNATLTPTAPASIVLVQVHYERWACLGGTSHEMVEGNGTIEIKLVPGISENGALRLAPTIGHVDASGLVGELLRSGSLGEVVRDGVGEALLSAVRPASDYKTLLPPAAQGNVTLRRAQFFETGAGRLSIVLNGDIQVSGDKVTTLTSELKASEAKGQASTAETAPR
jgi:hypothetical protein